MKIGDKIHTPRFLTVKIAAIFQHHEDAYECGYAEPTHYRSNDISIVGKHIGLNRMRFAAVYKLSP